MKKKLHTLLVLCLLAASTLHAQYTVLLDFDVAGNGGNPWGSLISDGNFLYGMTRIGGKNDLGTIFKINPDGTGYTKLLDFYGTSNGSNPHSSLISIGSALYGMTHNGGAHNLGTIFKINHDGTDYAKLMDFDGANNGRNPQGFLISDGTSLYGMTWLGGTHDLGTIFKINLDGTGYTKLMDFNGTSNGARPQGSLVTDGTSLYGMTTWGGMHDQGIIFKIDPDGTDFTKLADFGTVSGSFPRGSLISDGTFLYGMTQMGGSSNDGIIFKINPDGTDFTELLIFNSFNGARPFGSLFSDGKFLYGMTELGGAYGYGAFFKINPDGTGYTKLIDFDNDSKGCYPLGSLISDGTYLYGMTPFCGSANVGTVFKYCIPPIADAPGNVSACDSYTLPGLSVGNYYTATNGGGTLLNAGDVITSTQTLYSYTTNGSCSDENSFEVIINYSPINTITVSGSTLTADEAGAIYQWLDCDNGNAEISEATNQSYEPGVSGNFAVEITKDGCTSISDCQSLTIVGLNEHTQINFSVYPNPNTGDLTILLGDEVYSDLTVVIRNSFGQVVTRNHYNSTNTIDLTMERVSGIYFVEIRTGNKSAVQKVIIN